MQVQMKQLMPGLQTGTEQIQQLQLIQVIHLQMDHTNYYYMQMILQEI